jgi:hypothetical protein
MRERSLNPAVNDLLRSRYLNRSDLVELLVRCRRHPGARVLRL